MPSDRRVSIVMVPEGYPHIIRTMERRIFYKCRILFTKVNFQGSGQMMLNTLHLIHQQWQYQSLASSQPRVPACEENSVVSSVSALRTTEISRSYFQSTSHTNHGLFLRSGAEIFAL